MSTQGSDGFRSRDEDLFILKTSQRFVRQSGLVDEASGAVGKSSYTQFLVLARNSDLLVKDGGDMWASILRDDLGNRVPPSIPVQRLSQHELIWMPVSPTTGLESASV